MHELTIADGVVPASSIVHAAQLRRRGGYSRSYRKNVCLITLNGSGNGWSFWNFGNGFGGF